MAQLAAFNIEGCRAQLRRSRRHLIRRHEQKLRVRINEPLDEPRTGHPVDLHFFPRNPFHDITSAIADTILQSTRCPSLKNRRHAPSPPSLIPPCPKCRIASPESRRWNHPHGARTARLPCRMEASWGTSKVPFQRQTLPLNQ